ncbi:flagellar biosynthesis anti-sigma factor FlgM [Fluoribacter dumoffii]|uniref:flagellar biosynthesis anti-sigma factor FlgM n=1 Tax=Fluoribacter dumoffii TaxID=463 RepID=UPI002243C8F9|nr:flagellar biosynthesis anti-sigma factor FlgM [Fluoribacter dumoffii]MCW8417954.1 flagellar biosynthesis anti-sigma factor FlgM [Fluoribacter dumoffii]MCW8454204.1 flagellar biosynthesis anti-sigma factor FlgM [Fluoribacter dumoffii]MCW8461722.1 flagellar biosynthesis anti-sigma factor FlgM [Fluoribacter dumoffii]MCW8481938.1 flagellar biosynthesis anti-sigma factor FlgM [Fluoribacter dumoffii]
MFNQISDAVPVKSLDTDNRLKTRNQEKIKNLIEDASSHVSISDTSKQLEALKNSLKEGSEINEARVLYFKSEIALGNYQIDSDKIAMNMLNVEPA